MILRSIKVVPNEENVGIYRRYIVYREGSTRYFMEKNRRGDIYAKMAKISTIYQLGEINWWFCEKIASSGKISTIYRRLIGDKSSIFWRFIADISAIYCHQKRFFHKIADISPIFWPFLRKYLSFDFSPRNIVLTLPDTLSPIYPEIFLLAYTLTPFVCTLI